MKRLFSYAVVTMMAIASAGAQEVVVHYETPLMLTPVTLPQLPAGEESMFRVEMGNRSPDPNLEFSSIRYRVTINDTLSVEKYVPIYLKRGSVEWLELPTPVLPAGQNKLRVEVLKINGKPVSGDFTMNYIGVPKGRLYKRKMVTEEFTGLWCQYCVDGIIGFEDMAAEYPDWIGIAIHYDDEFYISSYQSIISRSDFHSGYPGSVSNRDTKLTGRPMVGVLRGHKTKIDSSGSGVNLDISSKFDEEGIDVTVNSTFGFDNPECDYRLAIVLTEDGLEGKQSNGAYGDSWYRDPWGSGGYYVDWTFTHTARYINSAYGAVNSIPTAVAKGETYEYKERIPKGVIKDFNNVHVIAMLIDKATGIVLNANIADAGKESVPCERMYPDLPLDNPQDALGWEVEDPEDSKGIQAESVTLSETQLTLKPGRRQTITGIVMPEDTTDKTIVWETSNPDVAIVQEGLIKAVDLGSCEITATCGFAVATCYVTVSDGTEVATLSADNDIEVYDVSGRLIFRGIAENAQLSESGIYIVRTKAGVKKIIIN